MQSFFKICVIKRVERSFFRALFIKERVRADPDREIGSLVTPVTFPYKISPIPSLIKRGISPLCKRGMKGDFVNLIIAVASVTPEQVLLHLLKGWDHASPAGHFHLLFILNDEGRGGENAVE